MKPSVKVRYFAERPTGYSHFQGGEKVEPVTAIKECRSFEEAELLSSLATDLYSLLPKNLYQFLWRCFGDCKTADQTVFLDMISSIMYKDLDQRTLRTIEQLKDKLGYL